MQRIWEKSMDSFKVIISDLAESDLDGFLEYLSNKKKSYQAARAVYADFIDTKDKLKLVAGSLKLDQDPDLSLLGYRRIRFSHHAYFMLYRVEENVAFVDRIYHESQDYQTDKWWL